MNDQDQVARDVLALIEKLGIPYVITGSYVSNLYGHPRATHDLDIVVELADAHVEPLIAGLGPDYYADASMAREAIRHRDQFNVIHIPSGAKVDFWVRRKDPWQDSRFSRRVRVALWGLQIAVPTPEDAILSKLLWHRKGGGVSDVQLRDVQGVYEVQRDRLDLDYLRTWADALSLRDLLDRLTERKSP